MIEARITALIEAEEPIAEDARLIRSIPGVGPVACMQLIAQMPELGGSAQSRSLHWLAWLHGTSIAVRTAESELSVAAANASATHSTWQPSMQSDEAAPSERSTKRLRTAGKPAKLAPHCRRQKASDRPQRHA
jgi:transposase